MALYCWRFVSFYSVQEERALRKSLRPFDESRLKQEASGRKRPRLKRSLDREVEKLLSGKNRVERPANERRSVADKSCWRSCVEGTE